MALDNMLIIITFGQRKKIKSLKMVFDFPGSTLPDLTAWCII